jgi:acyl-CoA reductase-like NAD-dependent aldehyde dehydrogenase
LIPAEDEEDAIRIANRKQLRPERLGPDHDADAAYRIARQMRTGGIGQNGMRLEFGMPFGGFKQSGIGREGGVEGLRPYLETKSILLDAAPAGL